MEPVGANVKAKAGGNSSDFILGILIFTEVCVLSP